MFGNTLLIISLSQIIYLEVAELSHFDHAFPKFGSQNWGIGENGII